MYVWQPAKQRDDQFRRRANISCEDCLNWIGVLGLRRVGGRIVSLPARRKRRDFGWLNQLARASIVVSHVGNSLKCFRGVFDWNPSLSIALGTGQTVEIRPLSEFLIPSIYRIFRASQNANRCCIINQMFAKSLPVDARVKNFR